MKVRKPFRWLVLLAALALVAAACGDGAEQVTPEETPTDDAPTTPTDEATTPDDDAAGEPQEGGTVVFGADQEPAIMNPHLTEGNLFANSLIAIAILESAYEVTPDFEYVPQLIDGEAEVTEDPFTVTYNIRDEAVWNDGTPVSAEDFEFHWQTQLNEEYDITSREGYNLIESAEIVDEKTITFTFSEVFAPYRTLFTNVLPKHVLEGEDFNTVWNDEITAASGPFQFASWDKGQQVTITRNDNYWDGDVSLDEVVIRFIPDSSTQVQQLRGGEIDMFYPQPQLDLVEQVDAIDGVTSAASAGTVWEHLDFNFNIPPLDQQFVRQAIGMGIDRETLVSELIAPLHPEATPLNNVIFMNNQAPYEDHWGEVIGYDPEGAIALLEENGCTRGDDGIFECDGNRLEFGFVTTAGNELRELAFEVIQAQLTEIGVQMNADFGEPAVVFGERLTNQDYDTFMFAWVGSPDPFGGNTIFVCEGDLNYTGYCNPEVDELINATNNETDIDARWDLYNQADALIAQDVPLIPLYQKPTFFAWNDSISGPQDNPTQWGPFWNIGEWFLTQ